MKKILSFILSLVIVFSFSACGVNKNVTEDQKETDKKSEETKKDNKKEETSKTDNKKKEKKVVSTSELLKNLHARKAIALAIDKDLLIDIIGDSAIPCNYIVPNDFSFSTQDEDFRTKYPDGFLKHDAKKAKEEWAIAKKELGFDKVEIEILTFNGEDAGKLIDSLANSLEQNLEGLKITANQQSFEQKSEQTTAGAFLIDLQGWSPDYIDPMAFLGLFSKESANNSGKYNNKEFEKLIEESKQTTDFDKRLAILQEAEKILLEDVALIPLYQDSEMYLVRPYIKNLVRNDFNTGFAFKYASTDKSYEGEKLVSTLGSADGAILDVNKVMDQSSINILTNINEGLLSFDKEGKLSPGIASSWEVSEDKKEYVFYLRNSKWSNGDPVTARDFVDSWQRLADKETKSEYTTMLETAGIKNAIKVINGEAKPEELGVEAIDDYTLKVTLDRPVPYFLDLMAFTCFFPVNKDFIDLCGEDYGTSIDTILYNGPYKITSWDLGYGLEFRKNESYWDLANIANDGVKFRMAKDLETALAMYDNHDIDICPLDGETAEQRKNSPDFRKYKVFAMFYLVINMDLEVE